MFIYKLVYNLGNTVSKAYFDVVIENIICTVFNSYYGNKSSIEEIVFRGCKFVLSASHS